MTGPLSGVRVLDLSTVILGPFAAQMLGELGADVIKIEAPGGDITRGFGPARNHGMTALHLNLNRNKRSIVLDLKPPNGKAALAELIPSADVFLHNMTDGAAIDLGVAYDDIRAIKHDIVSCWASGYGQGGAYSGRPANDDVIQAASGLAGVQGFATEIPTFMATIPADKAAAQTLAFSLTAALFHRERTGEGQEVHVPMLESVTAWHLLEHQWGHVFDPPLATPGYPRILTKERRPFRTKDGWISVTPYSDKHWRKFFTLIGKPELLEDPRFCSVRERVQYTDVLYAMLGELLIERTTSDWTGILGDAGIPAAPVHTLTSLFDDEHLKSVGFFVPIDHPTEGALTAMRPAVRFSATPAEIHRHAPNLGEHTTEVLREAGVREATIAAVMSGEDLEKPSK